MNATRAPARPRTSYLGPTLPRVLGAGLIAASVLGCAKEGCAVKPTGSDTTRVTAGEPVAQWQSSPSATAGPITTAAPVEPSPHPPATRGDVAPAFHPQPPPVTPPTVTTHQPPALAGKPSMPMRPQPSSP